MRDVGLNWRTRRYGKWGYLNQIQQQVADTIFPKVELLLRSFVLRFEDTIRRIQGQINLFQQALAAVEQDNLLDSDLEPVALIDFYEDKCRSFIEEVAGLVASKRDEIVRHLDSFLSEEVLESLEEAQTSVSRIFGGGTTKRQSSEVMSFYQQLKNSLRVSLDSHLRLQFKQFESVRRSASGKPRGNRRSFP